LTQYVYACSSPDQVRESKRAENNPFSSGREGSAAGKHYKRKKAPPSQKTNKLHERQGEWKREDKPQSIEGEDDG